jgi:hypothetical protein
MARSYYVYIEAFDQVGNKIELKEEVYYPFASEHRGGGILASERTSDAVRQVRERVPHLRGVRAVWSIHT